MRTVTSARSRLMRYRYPECYICDRKQNQLCVDMSYAKKCGQFKPLGKKQTQMIVEPLLSSDNLNEEQKNRLKEVYKELSSSENS